MPSTPTNDATPPDPLWRQAVGLLLVAVGAAIFAILFREALLYIGRHVLGAGDVVAGIRHLPRWLRLFAPAVGGLLAGLLSMAVANRGAGGVGSVMEAVVLGKVQLSMRGTLAKSAGSLLAIASGGSIGREGPLIQFGGALGKWVSDRLHLRAPSMRVLIAAGTAAGFTAAYNTPFAAVLFVLEVVTGVVALDTIAPALIATVIAAAVTRATVGHGPLYGMRHFELLHPGELAAFAVLGVLIALLAQAFMRLLDATEKLFHAIPLPLRPALGGLLTGVWLMFIPEVAGNGYEPLSALLDGNFAFGFVVLLLVGKCFGTSTSVSSGSPGGVFTPTLLIGGAAGWLFGVGALALGLHVGAPGGYALVGMAAATASTTHAPMLGAVMIFELSGDYAIVLPLLLATGLATFLSRRLGGDSVYTAELRRRGVGWSYKAYEPAQGEAPKV